MYISNISYLQLNDQYQFPYFTRTIPSDNYQAQAIVDIISRYGWTYVTVISSLGSYGERGSKVTNNSNTNNVNNNKILLL